jgi:hypothetical protein
VITANVILCNPPGRGESDKAKLNFNQLDYHIIHNGYTCKEIADIKMRYQTAFTWWLMQNEEICQFEEENGIVTWWTPSSMEYYDALVMVSQQTYRKALDNLEQLFIQRLLELTKLGMNGVGK